MNMEKVVFGFFVLLSATLNFGYVTGDIANPDHHNAFELYAAVVVNLITLVLKFGDRTQIGAVHLATSLVAVIQLAMAAVLWVSYTQAGEQVTAHQMASVVSWAIGACLANLVSVVLLVIETVSYRRR